MTIRWDTFIDYVRQIASSLAYHGFSRILIVNAHGSNRPVLDVAARLTIVENPDVQCGMLSWWDLQKVKQAVAGFRESEWTGHACELRRRSTWPSTRTGCGWTWPARTSTPG